jgi:hypothetical protein
VFFTLNCSFISRFVVTRYIIYSATRAVNKTFIFSACNLIISDLLTMSLNTAVETHSSLTFDLLLIRTGYRLTTKSAVHVGDINAEIFTVL